MHKSCVLWICDISLVLCSFACCWVVRQCDAQEPDGNRLVASLQDIRVKPLQGSKDYEVQVNLVVTNQSDIAYCVLPSQFSTSYSVQYGNGEHDFVAGGSSTLSTTAKDISDLDVPSVVIKPGHAAIVRCSLKTEAKPQGVVGSLELEYRCNPAYKGNTYQGILLYRDAMRIRSDVVVEFLVYERQWIIRPARAKKEEERTSPCEAVVSVWRQRRTPVRGDFAERRSPKKAAKLVMCPRISVSETQCVSIQYRVHSVARRANRRDRTWQDHHRKFFRGF